jgi:hypothetical protein
VLPFINTGYSVLTDMNCGICAKKSYNSSGNWTVDGKSTSKSLYSPFGNILGKSVRDSFCLMEACYSNKTEDHFEFFTIQNSTNPFILEYLNKDGGIGLAPGTDGFKSYGEYLIERKMISKNTVNMFYNASVLDPPLITLGLETNETRLGKAVNFKSSNYGSKDLA